MQVPAGKYLCLEGDKASTLYIVKSGMIVADTKSTNMDSADKCFGPGSIIDELSLLEDAPRQYSLRAEETSEIIEITKKNLKDTLKEKPSWLRSILQFLTGRYHIALDNKRKNTFVQSLPPLLYIISSNLQQSGTNHVEKEIVFKQLQALAGTSEEDTNRLLDILQELDLIKVIDSTIKASSLQIVTLLYETLKQRALTKKVSHNILSMTDQMILTAFMNVARESTAPRPAGIAMVTTAQLRDEAKKSMHGFTITMRSLSFLVDHKLLNPSSPFNVNLPLESIRFFYADFDKILDMLELNRIFPMLDKKLVM